MERSGHSADAMVRGQSSRYGSIRRPAYGVLHE
jgi:hypothetical protein